MRKNRKRLVEILCGLLIAIIFISSLTLQERDIDVALALAKDDAQMLEREAACKTWECIQNIGAE